MTDHFCLVRFLLSVLLGFVSGLTVETPFFRLLRKKLISRVIGFIFLPSLVCFLASPLRALKHGLDQVTLDRIGLGLPKFPIDLSALAKEAVGRYCRRELHEDRMKWKAPRSDHRNHVENHLKCSFLEG